MSQLAHEVAPGESLYQIARQHNTDIQSLDVLRGDTTYALGAANSGLDPKSVGPGDTVLVPGPTPDQACAGSCAHPAQEARSAASKLTSQAKAIDNDCAAAANDPISAKKTCNRKKWIIVIDPGHGGTGPTDSIPGKDARGESSWNNAVGVVSDVLEKTMTQRLAGILKQTIETRAQTFGIDVDVLLTKSDENKNLGGYERAKIANDAKADFFVILHFNSVNATALFPRQRDDEQIHLLDVTPGVVGHVRDKPLPHYHRRLFSNTTIAARGPLTLRRSPPNMPKDGPYVTSAAFSTSVVNRVVAAIKKLDSTKSIKIAGPIRGNYAALSSKHLGNSGIAYSYLEADFINVESGDRTWNAAEYAANIGSIPGASPTAIVGAATGGLVGTTIGSQVAGPIGAAAGAVAGPQIGANAAEALGPVIAAAVGPTPSTTNPMFQAAADAIADAIFEVIVGAIWHEISNDVQGRLTKLKDWWKKLMEPTKK